MASTSLVVMPDCFISLKICTSVGVLYIIIIIIIKYTLMYNIVTYSHGLTGVPSLFPSAPLDLANGGDGLLHLCRH